MRYKDDTYCHYCDIALTPENWTRDHIVPKGWGGSNGNINLARSCASCNTLKKSQWPTCPCELCEGARRYWHRNNPTKSANKVRFEYEVPARVLASLVIEKTIWVESEDAPYVTA